MAIGYDWSNIAHIEVYRGSAKVDFWIDVKLNRQDTTNNYSVVDTRLNSATSAALAGSGYSFALTGSAGRSGGDVWYFATETILTGQTTVYHNADGTKTASASAYCYNGYWGIEESFSGSYELPTIPRASIPTVNPNPFNIGDTITINTNRKSTAFTHTLSLTFGGYTYSIGSGITESTTLDTSTIASNLYQEIPNAAQGSGTITCTTYNGATLIGTKTASFTAKVANSNPTFDETYSDTNATTAAITGDNTYIIRNKSTLQISISNASAKNYATLDTLTAIIEGQTYSGTINGTSGTINIGTLNLSSNTTAQIILTDSRGIATTKNLTITILNWELPTAIIDLARQNNFYSETDIKVNANYSLLKVNNVNKNSITIKVRYKKVDDQSYGAYTTLTDNVTSTLTLDNNYAWDVQVLVQDLLGSTTYNLSIERGIPIIFFDRVKRSMGIDCFPSNNTSLEVSDEIIVNGDLIVKDSLGQNPVNIGNTVSSLQTSITNLTPVSLYNNSTGTTTGFDLSESINNFSYLEIYYRTGDGTRYKGSTKILLDGSAITASLIFIHFFSNTYYLKVAEIGINDKAFSFSANFQSINGGSPSSGNQIYVTRVLGYK